MIVADMYRCMDKNGRFVVETTNWEGMDRRS